MKIYFHGATGDVTGSAYQVKTKQASVLVDCSMFQGEGRRSKNRLATQIEGGHLDAVVLGSSRWARWAASSWTERTRSRSSARSPSGRRSRRWLTPNLNDMIEV